MVIKITLGTQVWQNTLNQLSGEDRRLFMASVVKGMGRGGVAWAKRELGWDRTTIRKGMHELVSGVICFDNVVMRGCKGFAATLPQLQDDLRGIGEASSQTDPTFRTTPLYCRLTATEAKRQLVEKGYNEKDLPSERSLCRMLGELGFKPRRVAKGHMIV